jgi:acetolactate synthase I/II/III large subunit
MQLCEEADCVIAVGASLNRYTTEHGYLYPNAKFVHIDSKPHVMMGGVRAAECYVQSDARAGVEALESMLAKRSFKQTGYRTGEVRERLANAWEDRTQYTIDPGNVDPREVILALDAAVPENINLFTGNGAAAAFSNMLFRRRRPLVQPGYFFSCIGQMLPAAMGGVVATGNKPAILVDGDASVMMHLAEFETMVRYNMPLLIVVMNNEALGSEYYKLDAHKMKKELSVVETPDLGALGKAFGGRGKLVKSVEDLKQITQEFLANPAPTLVDVRIDRSVISLPYRRIHYGRDE